MTDTTQLYALINQLWVFIRDHNETLSDNEDDWQRLMNDADQMLSQITNLELRNLLSKWIVDYFAYVDKRERRILQ